MLIRVLSGLYVYDFLESVKPICSFSLLTSLGRLKYLLRAQSCCTNKSTYIRNETEKENNRNFCSVFLIKMFFLLGFYMICSHSNSTYAYIIQCTYSAISSGIYCFFKYLAY